MNYLIYTSVWLFTFSSLALLCLTTATDSRRRQHASALNFNDAIENSEHAWSNISVQNYSVSGQMPVPVIGGSWSKVKNLNGDQAHVWSNISVQNDSVSGQVPVPVNASLEVLTGMRKAYYDPKLVSTMGTKSVQPMDSFLNLKQYYMSEKDSDVVLVVNGTKLPAHRFLLKVKSKIFADMFIDDAKTEFDLGQESVDIFKIVLKFFYTEKFAFEDNTNYKMAFDVFQMAKKFEINHLMALIEQTLEKLINLNNYLEILEFAQQNQLYDLNRYWNHFVYAKSSQIIAEESYLNESLAVVERILGALNVPQSYVLVQIKKLMESNPQLNVNHFRKIIFIEKCTVEDFLILNQMKFFDTTFLLENLVKRYQSLSVYSKRLGTSHFVPPRW